MTVTHCIFPVRMLLLWDCACFTLSQLELRDDGWGAARDEKCCLCSV